MRSRRNGIGLDYASRPRTRFVMAVSNRSNLNQAQIVKPQKTHCSNSSFFVQKFNFDFLSKFLVKKS